MVTHFLVKLEHDYPPEAMRAAIEEALSELDVDGSSWPEEYDPIVQIYNPPNEQQGQMDL